MSSLINRNEDIKKRLAIAKIVVKMIEEGMSEDFVLQLFPLAEKYEGLYDLLDLWAKETDKNEKDEIIADLQDEIEELQSEDKILIPFIHFDNLELIAQNVMEFKKSLRTEIERWGGLTKLSKATGIPLPSLSRFLNSPSLPRRVTLEKIAKALNLRKSTLLSKWAA